MRTCVSERLRELMAEGIALRLFPGAVAYVSRGGQPLFHEAFGARGYDGGGASLIGQIGPIRPIGPMCPIGPIGPIDRADLFDLASLTKLYTAAVALRLVGTGILRLDEPVRKHVPEVEADWTLEDLLAHRTGTTADLLGRALRHGIRPCEPRQEAALWCVIFSCEAEVRLAKGESRYSDVDFLLVQAACERATGRGLDALMASEVLEPLGLRETCFCPADRDRCVPTELDERWRHRLVVGEVHDEMAATLGGVAGHAGLFATAEEVGRFCEMWLERAPVSLPQDSEPAGGARGREEEDRGRGRGGGRGRWGLAEALSPRSRDFGLGWRMCNQSFFPSLERLGAVGHLGFTGTSAFLFPGSGTVFVLLSNRVHPRRDAAPSRLPLLGRMCETVAGV